jgi:hypothetical protein
MRTSGPLPRPSPFKRAFTPVFDGLWGGSAPPELLQNALASDLDSSRFAFGQHFANPGFEFGRPGRPVSLFPSLSQEAMERREAPPADRRRLANPKPGSAARHGRSPVTRGCRFRARWPSDVGPGASRRSNAMPLSGTASCSLFERRDRRQSSIEQNRNIYRACGMEVNPAERGDGTVPP